MCPCDLGFVGEEATGAFVSSHPEAVWESEDDATAEEVAGDAGVDEVSGMGTAEVSCNVYSSDRVDKIDNKSAGASGHTRRM